MTEISIIDRPAALCDIPDTMEKSGNPPLYEALMAIKPEGMSPNAWAVKAGVNRNVFNDIRKSGRARNDIIEKLLDAANVSYTQFDAVMAPVRSEVRPMGTVGASDVSRAFFGEKPLPALKLYGSAVGGEYGNVEEHIELTELHHTEVLDYLVRPASLANDQDAYALTIVGDSMVPRFKPGERVAVSPRSSIVIGDDVIVQLRGDGDDRITMVLVKELVRRSHSHVELKQYNPEVIFKVPRDRVAALHKVKGHYF